MKNLKKRFPLYSKLIQLYPSSYLRQYRTQTLQTYADMLDEPGLTRYARIRIQLYAYYDTTKHIMLQRHNNNAKAFLKHPQRYIIKRLTIIFIILIPTILMIVVPILFPQVYLPPSPFLQIINNTTANIILYEVLPLLATLTTLTIVYAWIATRHERIMRKRHKSQRVTWLLLTITSAIGVAGVLFTGTILISHYQAHQTLNRQKAASIQSQREHPTLACQLLPLASAQDILGKKAYLNNTIGAIQGQNSTGNWPSTDNTKVTACNYFLPEAMLPALYVNVKEYLTPQAQKDAQEFDKQSLDIYYNEPQRFSSITFRGYPGVILVSPTYKTNAVAGSYASMTVYVDNKGILVSGDSLNAVYLAVDIMVRNLTKPPEKPSVTKDQESAITAALKARNAHIPTSKELRVKQLEHEESGISGVFEYKNGPSGTFSAKQQAGNWVIASYVEM